MNQSPHDKKGYPHKQHWLCPKFLHYFNSHFETVILQIWGFSIILMISFQEKTDGFIIKIIEWGPTFCIILVVIYFSLSLLHSSHDFQKLVFFSQVCSDETKWTVIYKSWYLEERGMCDSLEHLMGNSKKTFSCC